MSEDLAVLLARRVGHRLHLTAGLLYLKTEAVTFLILLVIEVLLSVSEAALILIRLVVVKSFITEAVVRLLLLVAVVKVVEEASRLTRLAESW